MRACEKIKTELKAYLDEELAAANRARVQAHLDACQECREELSRLRWLGAELRQMDTARPAAALRARILSQVAEEKPPVLSIATEPELSPVKRPFWRRSEMRFALAGSSIAAAALLVGILYGRPTDKPANHDPVSDRTERSLEVAKALGSPTASAPAAKPTPERIALVQAEEKPRTADKNTAQFPSSVNTNAPASGAPAPRKLTASPAHSFGRRAAIAPVVPAKPESAVALADRTSPLPAAAPSEVTSLGTDATKSAPDSVKDNKKDNKADKTATLKENEAGAKSDTANAPKPSSAGGFGGGNASPGAAADSSSVPAGASYGLAGGGRAVGGRSRASTPKDDKTRERAEARLNVELQKQNSPNYFANNAIVADGQVETIALYVDNVQVVTSALKLAVQNNKGAVELSTRGRTRNDVCLLVTVPENRVEKLRMVLMTLGQPTNETDDLKRAEQEVTLALRRNRSLAENIRAKRDASNSFSAEKPSSPESNRRGMNGTVTDNRASEKRSGNIEIDRQTRQNGDSTKKEAERREEGVNRGTPRLQTKRGAGEAFTQNEETGSTRILVRLLQSDEKNLEKNQRKAKAAKPKE